MMLRSRNSNNINNAAPAGKANGKAGDVVKRGKKTTLTEPAAPAKGEPTAKRAALNDLSQAISNVLIDSSKKATVTEKPAANRRSNTRSNSASGSLEKIEENADASIIEIPVEDPCPGYDFDKESAADPHAVHLYAFDIFKYYQAREKQFAVGDYMKHQHRFNADNRAILMDWMVEIQETFELNHETLYLSVKLVDLYLASVEDVEKHELQLIACAAIFIASKFDERSPPLIDDFIYVTEDTFDRSALINMEMKMLDTVGYDLGCPLSYRFVRRYARVCRQDMATLTLARYVLETSLLFYEMCGVSESRIAAAAFLLALKMKNPAAKWTPILHKYTGYKAEDVEPLMWELNHMMHASRNQFAKLETVFSKYSHEVFFKSASVPLLDDIYPSDRPVQVPEGQGFTY